MVDKYDEIIYEIKDTNESSIALREKYIRLKKILERVCKEITSEESLQFPSLFSRLVFISQKYDLPRSLEWNLQTIRVKSSFLQKSNNNVVSQTQYDEAIYNIKFLVEIYVSKVITIENLVMVNSYEEENSILIYTGRFTSSSVVSIIKY